MFSFFSGIRVRADDIFGDVINMLRDEFFRSGITEYSGVYHGYESYCYKPQGASSCKGQALWVTAGYVKSKAWWYRYVALYYASLHVYGRLGHVAWADPSMDEVDSTLKLYHHCPLVGTNDDWNSVGWREYVTGSWSYGYVKAVWDIPNGAKNDVVKRGEGRFLQNSVWLPSSTSLWEAKTSWSKVLACNALKYSAVSDWDAEVKVSTITWNRDWDWGCWCWRDSYETHVDYWHIDYL